jgi:hypothetical protein
VRPTLLSAPSSFSKPSEAVRQWSQAERWAPSISAIHPAVWLFFAPIGFKYVGEARHCCSLEHLLSLTRKSRNRYFLDEAQKEKMLEPFAPQIFRHEGDGT